MTKGKSSRHERNLAWAQQVYATNKGLDYKLFAESVKLDKRKTNDQFQALLGLLATGTKQQKKAAGKARWTFKVKSTSKCFL